MSRRRVLITGVGVVSPIGNDVPTFWNGIVEGRSGAGPITRFDTTDYKTKFACEVRDLDMSGVSPAIARKIDRVTSYAMHAATQAVADGDLKIASDESPQRLGVLTGSGIGGLEEMENNYQTLLDRGPSRISPLFVPRMMINASAGQIAIANGFQGPNFSTVSACASTQHALGMAYELVSSGAADVMLTGGSEASIVRLGVGGFNTMKALSTRNESPETASRPFCKSRDGFVMGEGGAIFIFETEERARARGAKVYAEFMGFGMTDDANHIAAPLPTGAMAAQAMRGAAEQSGINLDDVDYINAHGTSTPLNDVMETRAIREVFGDHANRLMVSSTKSQVGHLLGASGAVELAAITLGIERGVVPPTINYDDPDPDCDLDYVPNEPREKAIRYALSNSFGFGGHNACLCVGRYDG